MASNKSRDQLNKLKKSVYLAARDNQASHLKTLLCNHDDSVVKEIISHHTEEDGQWTTPLLIAARNGHGDVIHELISNFKADVNQTGTIKIDGQTLEEANPLWCSAAIGNFSMVIYLIGHGAQVNKTTANGSTALRAACYFGYMDIIMFLVIEHDADVSVQNKLKSTCLMLSSNCGHKEVVKFLLKHGSSVNVKNHESKNALYGALENDHLDVAEILIRAGAENIVTNENSSCLKIAACKCNTEIVELIITSKGCSRIEKIDAYELLGASFANSSDHESSIEAYSYLRKGMVERLADPVQYKSLPDPAHTFKNHVECQTLEELDAMKDDIEMLFVEGLVLKERILGNNIEVYDDMRYRGAAFADNKEYNKCIKLWWYSVNMMQRMKNSIAHDIGRFVCLFVVMMSEDMTTDLFQHAHNVFERAIDELKNDKGRIEKEGVASHNEYVDNYEENIGSCLLLLIILLKATQSPLETNMLRVLACKFLQLKPKLCTNDTPLHIATNMHTEVNEDGPGSIIGFPNDELAKLLIICGADVNAENKNGLKPQLQQRK